MGVAAWFQAFCNNLQVDNQATISPRYGAITTRLNTDFWNTTSSSAHSLYAGSYGRNTAIRGISDLDMVFQLPYSLYTRYDAYFTNGQSALLQLVKESIERTYSRSSVRGDGQVIQVPFADGIVFEVVPGFANLGGGFTYPDANAGGRWRQTDPRAEIEAIRERSAATNGNLVLLCRMMRQWKSEWSVPISGLLIDTLAYQFIESYQYRDKSYFYYDFYCRDFLKFMSERSRTQNYWRAPGSGHYTFGGELFQYKALRCYNIALEAIEHEQATTSREYSAKRKWREIFGSRFPS
ncbi:SMODS domain-containing nucleotidyltransferase [Stenotrophomonas rhizophila]